MRDALRIAAIALLVFAVSGLPIFLMLVVGGFVGWGVLARFRSLIDRPGASWVLAGCAAIGLYTFWARLPEMIEAEGLSGLVPVLRDRFRMQSNPAVTPQVVFSDRPQRLWIHAPGYGERFGDAREESAHLSITLGAATAIVANEIGHDLFTAIYDPRRDGALATASGPVRVRLSEADNTNVAELELEAIVPRAHPRWLCASGTRAIAVSEETDEIYLIEGTAPPKVIPVADQPIRCAFTGHLAVIAHRSGTLALLDPQSATIKLIPAATPGEEHTAIAINSVTPSASAANLEFVGHPTGIGTNFVAPSDSAPVLALGVRAAGTGTNFVAPSDSAPVLALGVRGRRTGIAFYSALKFAASSTQATAIPHAAELDHETNFVALPEAPDHLLYANQTLYAALRRAHTILRIDDPSAPDHRKLHLGRPAVTLRATADGRHLLIPVTDHLQPGESGHNHEIRDQLLLIDTRTFRITTALPCEGNPTGLTATTTTTILAALTGDSRATPCPIPTNETNFVAPSPNQARTPQPADDEAANETNFVAPSPSQARTPQPADDEAADETNFVAPSPSQARTLQPADVPTANETNFVAPLPGIYDVAEISEAPSPSRGGRTLLVATSPALGAIAVFDRATGEQLALHTVAATPETDAEHGELAFYEATRARISCASCHLHADSDLAHHDIGHGRASPTLTVRGVAGTSPYLRGASYPTLDALDTFAQTILGGYEHDLPNRAALLGAYVRSLPPVSPPQPFEIKSVAQGLDAFIKAGCERCHAFPAFTNLAQVPASFLFPELGKTDRLLDTPTLLDLSRTAPYLDDGRAKSIEAVLVEHNRSNRHGDVAALSANERRALVAFLERL